MSVAEVGPISNFIRTGTGTLRGLGVLGTAGAVVTALALANDAVAFGGAYIDQKKLDGFIAEITAKGIINKETGEINYALAGLELRNAGPEKFPEDQKKNFYRLIVANLLDPSLRANDNIGADGEVTNDRLYQIDIQSGVSKPDAKGNVEYNGAYDMPFKVSYSGEKVVVTFTNGPVQPHERARIIQAFNAMGSDAEVVMSPEARRGYVEAWKNYANDKDFANDEWVKAEAKGRNIDLPTLPDGRPDRAPLATMLREEFMILAGIDKLESTDIPPAIRPKAA